jgi:hypothetical protein
MEETISFEIYDLLTQRQPVTGTAESIKMGVARLSETSVNQHQTTRSHKPEVLNFLFSKPTKFTSWLILQGIKTTFLRNVEKEITMWAKERVLEFKSS